jgi:hypothetical protein
LDILSQKAYKSGYPLLNFYSEIKVKGRKLITARESNLWTASTKGGRNGGRNYLFPYFYGSLIKLKPD